jgi:hypothetical protein
MGLKVNKHEIILNFFWPKSNPYMPLVNLKVQCHEIFCSMFFSWITFLQAHENNIRVISNFFQNSWIYSQVKVHHLWCTLNCEYFCEFSKKTLNGPNGILRSLGETDSWKKQKSKISWHSPFKEAKLVHRRR